MLVNRVEALERHVSTLLRWRILKTGYIKARPWVW